MKTYQLQEPQAILRYQEFPGSGAPLIFIHGLGCASSCDYPRIAADPALRERHTLLMDLLGSGFSDKPENYAYTISAQAQTIKSFIDTLKLTEFDLFGHSMGGSIAVQLASLCQGSIHHLILSEPNLDPGGGFFSRAVAAFSEPDYLAFGHERILRSAIKDNNLIWAGSLAVASPRAIYRQAVSLVQGSSPTWRDQLASFCFSKTILFGEHSLPDPDIEILPQIGVKIGIVPDAGHSMAWENPAGVAAAIREALS
jgi:pimeloyl-ACP methyl ester carboxylesterase